MWPKGHILNEGITPIGCVGASLMLCGAMQISCGDGKFLPHMEIYTMEEFDLLRADASNGRPMCPLCLEIIGL